MTAPRRVLAWLVVAALLAVGASGAVRAQPADADRAEVVLTTWYKLMLELVRHTPTYSPPVASRAFGYIGVTAFETLATGSGDLRSLAGQLNGLTAPPPRVEGARYDDAVALEAALAAAIRGQFANTGPTGQRAIEAIDARLRAAAAAGLPAEVVARSAAYGAAVAAHVLAWSQDDGGVVVENMGFPLDYQLAAGPDHWAPTSDVAQQQRPLLPHWGENRPFVMADGAACPTPPPPAYSEAPGSVFYGEALEVFETQANLSAEQVAIARFWSDDPMLSTTPPGHWVSIAMQALEAEGADAARSAEVLARLGVALSDAFIACWQSKYEHDLVRPVTYIRRLIDPTWQALLNTPPFPEYPSGHSTQSAAAAVVLTDQFGEDYAFEDITPTSDGLAARSFPSFWAAAEEAGISRLYGGIHFRSAIVEGLAQGRCVGAQVNALRTRR